MEIDDKKLKFSLMSPRVKSAQLVKERGGTINLNRKNNFSTRVKYLIITDSALGSTNEKKHNS